MNDNERHRDEARERPDALTRLLRDADPAADDPGLNPTEVAQMRREIIETTRGGIATHRAPIGSPAWMRPPWMRPALALATIGIVALGLWVLAGPPPEPVADSGAASTSPAGPPGVIPGQSAVIPDQREVISDRPAVIPDQRAVISDQPAAIQDQPAPIPDQPVTAAPDPPAMTVAAPSPVETAAATNDPSPPDVRARTVQFTAPRGTRIIWTLDPEFESPISGPEARQEQGK